MLRSSLFSRLGVATPVHIIENIGRYTRWVWAAKLLLVLAALGLVLITSAILFFNSRDKNAMRVVFSAVTTAVNERPVMQEPKYQGVDKHGRPFTVSARQAAQTDFQGQRYIQMQTVDAEMTMGNGLWLNVRADNGTLSTARNLLELVGDVQLYTDTGYEMHTPKATVDFSQSITRGDQGVEGQGVGGYLRAQHFSINSKTHIARFDGQVFVRLYTH